MKRIRCLSVAISLIFLFGAQAGETATATAVVAGGSVSKVLVSSSGADYLWEPRVVFTGGGGDGAVAIARLSSSNTVARIEVVQGGAGYQGIPTVTIEAPPPSVRLEATLVPKLSAPGFPSGRTVRIVRATSPSGPFIEWTNAVVSTDGTVTAVLSTDSPMRYFRAIESNMPDFVWIKPGTFMMGSPDSEPGRSADERQHQVTLSKGFWICNHEVTQGEYFGLMGNNPSAFTGDLSLPVDSCSWNDAVAYCQKLTTRERLAHRITEQEFFRLPTEAEWEYSARAGTTTALPGDLAAIAWTSANSLIQTWPVKRRVPNPWGLYDVIGNVAEYCADWYADYVGGAEFDPVGPTRLNGAKVLRGGYYNSWTMRVAFRDYAYPDASFSSGGFRVVLSNQR